jgi:large subunit ribosomal protein L9
MQIILLERIEKLGQMGDVVTVRPGFARNYLLPQGKAKRATKENLALFEQQRAQLEAENLERRGEAEAVGAKLDGLVVTIIRQAGESGQLYGSVNARNLSDAITEAGFSVSRDQVALDAVIKTLGLHKVAVRLHPEVTVTVTANVARSDAEAKLQAKEGHLVSAEEQHEIEEAAIEAIIGEVEAAEKTDEGATAGGGDGAEAETPETAKPESTKTGD